MNKISRYISILLVLALTPFISYAQFNYIPDSTYQEAIEEPIQEPFDYHIHIGTGVYSGWGNTHVYTHVAPTFEYQVTPKLKTFGGFSFVNDINTTALYRKPNFNQPSYAPLRAVAQSASIHGGIIYQPNSHLTLAASAFYIGGHYDPLWNFSNSPLPLKAYGFSAEMSYRFNDQNSIHIYFDFIRDQAGTLINPYLNNYLGFGTNPYHPFSRPFGCSPFNYDPSYLFY